MRHRAEKEVKTRAEKAADRRAGGLPDNVRPSKAASRAGQFFIWRFLGGPGASRANPFSLAAAPDGRSLTISARIVGDGTARLARLTPGTPVLFEGPYGTMYEYSHAARNEGSQRRKA